jgi:hypothetical protein
MALTIIPWFIFYEWSSLFEMLVVLVYVWDIWDIAHHLFFISIILQDLKLFKFKGPVTLLLLDMFFPKEFDFYHINMDGVVVSLLNER